jgi:hypothetical protein
MDTRAQESLVTESKAIYDTVVELSDIALALVGGGVGEIVVG